MAKCVGCGYCCLKSPCLLAATHFTMDEMRCPALFWDGQRYWCGLAMKDIQYALVLHVGEGCCSGLNSWRGDVRFRG
jgi:hypothetical protein